MKSTGVVRKVDELGRVVIPVEIRRNLGIEIKDALEIFVDNEKIVLRKYVPADCDVFTGETEDLIEYNGKKISIETIKELAKIACLI